MTWRYGTSSSGKSRKTVLIAAAVVICIAVVVVAVLLAVKNDKEYRRTVEMLRGDDYSVLTELIASEPEYESLSGSAKASKYRMADKMMRNDLYFEAAQVYAMLGDYRSSEARMQRCCYTLASELEGEGSYDSAYDMFLCAGDYRDAAEKGEKVLYAAGHEAFMADDYDTAFKYFGLLGDKEKEHGALHFMTLKDAEDYLDSRLENMYEITSFYLAGEYEEDIYLEVINYLPFHTGSAFYNKDEKRATVVVDRFYTGDIILDAWEEGDTSELTEEENETLELALELVEQAKAETENELEMERWLHDWLCEKIEYESPNMDVSTEEYLKLRELTCVGAMLDGKANCQGYTDAFYLLGNLAGFEVERLFGSSEEEHMWNTVLLNDQWYIVDVTFDDLSEEDGEGWIYTYFNAPLDTELYTVDGGVDAASDVSVQFNEEVSYFGMEDTCFTSAKSAANYLVSQYKKNGEGWVHVVVEGKEIKWNTFSNAIESALMRANRGASWMEYLTHYNGNTYMSVYWE